MVGGKAMKEECLLVIGGGIAGLTAAIEAAETGREVFVVEREPYLGGRVARMNKYFPKLCPPYCGLEINFRRLRGNQAVRAFTRAEVERVSGGPGNYEVTVRLNPRYVDLDRCTACGECEPVCPAERPDDFNYGMGTTKAVYLPHALAMPMKHVIDGDACLGPDCGKCVQACPYDAIDLAMEQRSITLRVGAITMATGWKPYDANNLGHLGFGALPDVITNVMMERLAAVNGPTQGRILRRSDGRPAKRVAFVQCAGSRDVNHLPYCSAICCLASLKQARYVVDQYPEAEVHVFYIDIRTPGEYEDFYGKVRADERIHFHKGKVARVTTESSGDLVVEADDILSGRKIRVGADLVVLAVGMAPEAAAGETPGLAVAVDEFGFAAAAPDGGIFTAGVARRPADVVTSTRDGTAAALRMIQTTASK